MTCRHCKHNNLLPFLDLGEAPPSNAYLSKRELSQSEVTYPLKIEVCTNCWLVQTRDFASRETFFSKDYAYFSSYSSSWVQHAKDYVLEMKEKLSLGTASLLVEIAANDGYLLQFARAEGIPCIGVEPTSSTAKAAREKGIDIVEDFFGLELAKNLVADGRQADLITANNVLAHVPDINDFVQGFATLLKPDGVATFEFPHILEMLQFNQFDTVYHEHYSYLSLSAVERIFNVNGLSVFDVQTLPFHGGSLRVFAQRRDSGARSVQSSVQAMLELEKSRKIKSYDGYKGFQAKINKVAQDLLNYLTECQQKGLSVAAYGAAAKGNTFLNFLKIDYNMIRCVADLNPAKQGKFMPGSHVPIVSPDELLSLKPDRILILPWNLKNEIKAQLSPIKDWGGMFITAVPELTIES